MENNTDDNLRTDSGNTSSTIFGTSSDDIVEGLHRGAFQENKGAIFDPDDSDMIVNEQEQNEIVNPVEEEFTVQPAAEAPSPEPVKQKTGLTKEDIEGEIIDDGIDTKDEALKPES